MSPTLSMVRDDAAEAAAVARSVAVPPAPPSPAATPLPSLRTVSILLAAPLRIVGGGAAVGVGIGVPASAVVAPTTTTDSVAVVSSWPPLENTSRMASDGACGHAMIRAAASRLEKHTARVVAWSGTGSTTIRQPASSFETTRDFLNFIQKKNQANF
jgi:hypothetical protein